MPLTEQEREEPEKELYRLLIDNVKDYAIFVLTPDGLVNSWNSGAERLLGYPENEILGKSFELFFTPEDIANGIPQLEMRQSLSEGAGNDDRWHVRKDGSYFWAGGTMTPLWDGSHNLRGFAKVMRDRTEWKRVQEELLSQAKDSDYRQRLYNAALSNTPDLVYLFDLQHRFTYANEQLLAMWGRSWDDAIGKNCLELGYEPWHAAMHDRELSHVIATKQPIKGEVPFDGALGRRIYEYIFVPVLGEDGEVEAVAGTSRDVTDRDQAEEKVRHSEERFRSLMDQAPFSIHVFSPDGRTIRVNRAWEELWGQRSEQAEGYNILQDKTLERRGVLHYIQLGFSGQTARIPATLYDLNAGSVDGPNHEAHYRWLSAVIYPIHDTTGNVREVVLIHEDITARKHAEEALRESEKRFRQLADTMPQIVWSARPDGEIDYLNQRWHELTGLPASTGIAEWLKGIHPEESERVRVNWNQYVQSGQPFEMELRLLDCRNRTYRWHLIRMVAVHDDAKRVVRWFGTGTDVHDRKRDEESSRFLAEASAALASVVDYESTLQKVANLAVPHFADWSAVDVADEGRLRRLAAAHNDPHGARRAHELIDQYPLDADGETGIEAVFRTGEPEMVGEITKDLIDRVGGSDSHLNMIHALGLTSYICVPLIVSGNSLGVLTFATAESGRKYTAADLALANELAHRAAVAIENTQLYQSLREADQRKDEFLATLAHELRNPLAPIRNALEILKVPTISPTTVRQTRDMMERQVHHLVRLVDDLLDVSRVMRGKIELRKEPVELAAIIASAVETAQPLIESQSHRLTVTIASESLLLNADPVRLAQVVGNLLTNAAKYTEPHGKIELTAERFENQAVLRVRDNGIGIASEMLPHIFDLFVQVDHAATRSQGGLGIGLTLVKNLVDMHEGTIKANSEGLGKGSEFAIRLPIISPSKELSSVDETRGSTAERSTAGAPVKPVHCHRLLVVDDNKDAAISLAMSLRLQGHVVEIAHDGPTALRLIDTFRPSMLFLDIGMPNMDGYEVARRIRQSSELQHVALTALTGWGQVEDRKRSSEAGFDHHLVKPPEPSAVEDVLAWLQNNKHPD